MQVFSCEFCEISKNTFFTEHLWTTASTLICDCLFIFNSMKVEAGSYLPTCTYHHTKIRKPKSFLSFFLMWWFIQRLHSILTALSVTFKVSFFKKKEKHIKEPQQIFLYYDILLTHSVLWHFNTDADKEKFEKKLSKINS